MVRKEIENNLIKLMYKQTLSIKIPITSSTTTVLPRLSGLQFSRPWLSRLRLAGLQSSWQLAKKISVDLTPLRG